MLLKTVEITASCFIYITRSQCAIVIYFLIFFLWWYLSQYKTQDCVPYKKISATLSLFTNEARTFCTILYI